MIDSYNKVIDGFEFCKRNLENELSLDQFMACKQLVLNYINLCEYYINIQTIKDNKEYLNDVCEERIDILSNMIDIWESQYSLSIEQDAIETQKQSDIITNLNLQEEFIRQKECSERVVVQGFVKYMKKKKKTKKKNG